MAIHSFLKVEKGDPDWQFTPEDYFSKQFKIIDASMVELEEGKTEQIILRQTPTERELLAKHLRIHLQKKSTLDMMILNDVDSKIQQVFLYDIFVKDNANFNLGIFAKNGKFNKHIFQIHLEENASFTAYGLISNEVGGDTEVVTKVVHSGPMSRNNQLFLGIAGKNSQTVFQNINIVEENGYSSEIGTEASNLIISEGGRCYSKPESYVNADFVETIQRTETTTISLEKISYLQSKGIPKDKSQEMIISGFKNLVFSLVNQPGMQEEVREMYLD